MSIWKINVTWISAGEKFGGSLREIERVCVLTSTKRMCFSFKQTKQRVLEFQTLVFLTFKHF